MSDKAWAMNCILAGVKVGRLLEKNKPQEATDCLANLTSEFTTVDINYLMGRIRDILAEKGGENNGS